MLHVTEDTPPDMLAGAMDLTVHLPTGITAKMAVERSTPMMDLLVQITTAHHLQLSNYSLQALGTAPSSDHRDKILPYKPNTPIGTLDTQHIKVVPKIRTIPVPKNVPPGHQPFESTFRLKVHLPRNQLYVARVSRNVKLEDIMKKVCEEKNLDPAKYEFKHPGNLDETLDPKLTLSDYQITEIFVVAKGTASLSQAFSSSDIMALRKEEERKQMHNKTGGGVFNLIFRRGKSSMGSGSVSSDTRSISPTHSDDSRSVTPPGVVQKPILPPPKQDPPTDRPKPPQRKRKPAPKPPTQPPTTETTERNANDAENSRTSSEDIRRISEEKSDGGEIQMRRTEGGLVISHSRTSSDSSGYHEASVLSENCNTSLPRRPKSAFVGSGDMEKLSKMHSQSSSNLSKMASHSKSTMSLGVPGRKKKAAPPPPPPIRANPQIQIETASPVVASQTANKTESLASHQALDSLDSQIHTLSENIEVAKPFGSTDSGIAQETNEKLSETEDCRPITPPPPPLFLDEPPIEEETKNEERLQEKVEINDLDPVIEEESSKEVVQTKEIERTNEVSKESSDLYEIDWQYQLPSPPKAFRDTSPVINDESTITDFKDSVVTSPELFEKEKPIDTRSTTTFDTQSVATFVGDEPPLNTLSLEHLEKRKSLVYNRELSTSLKVSDEDRMDPYTNSLNKFETTFIEVQKSSHKEISKPKYVQKTTHTLPNFKISTYDRPKEKIKVFEDDTIRSSQNSYATNKTYSQLNRYYAASSMENISIRKNSIDNKTGEREYTFYRAENGPIIAKNYGPSTGGFNTESFNTETAWSPGKLVSRSRSYLTLNGTNKHKVEKQTNGKKGIERSNSLYDISGLQSLGVMRLIQSKLNTPTSSLENLNFIEEKSEPSNNSYSHQKEAAPQEVVQKTAATEKIYKYQGPPSINMSTWSERPKVPVSVKEDEDYKLGNNISSKLIVNTTNNNITSNNSIEIKNGEVESVQPSISIKVNGTEIPTTTTESKAGNVVIKIGSTPSQPKIIDNQRFISHTTASGYRRPLTDINKNQRPHSIAFGSDIDISRVPVVRSVELKKPFKDFGNTSVTQIGSAEPTQQNNFYGRLKPTIVPVVRGFKTLPKEREAFVPNSQVPFSQGTLRRTASSNLYDEINANTTDSKPREVESVEKLLEPVESTVNPPPPPMMPKVSLRKPVVRHIEPVVDTRDQLLSAIRNFGGKKGLRPAKV
ncbi:unnamed protein product [Psylliodes chrysocephalus]|uniref:WH2 domain-containing protein n=1 Tax=Psylliodes chrysocephalus TaxID=3402493 RepID=A0A9P0CUG0_9CUCU|nr:unnamed protein product [Psylliodes chrysocephala]